MTACAPDNALLFVPYMECVYFYVCLCIGIIIFACQINGGYANETDERRRFYARTPAQKRAPCKRALYLLAQKVYGCAFTNIYKHVAYNRQNMRNEFASANSREKKTNKYANKFTSLSSTTAVEKSLKISSYDILYTPMERAHTIFSVCMSFKCSIW